MSWSPGPQRASTWGQMDQAIWRTPFRAVVVTGTQILTVAACVAISDFDPVAPFAIQLVVELTLLVVMWVWSRRDRHARSLPAATSWPGADLRRAAWRTPLRAGWFVLNLILAFATLVVLGFWHPWAAVAALGIFVCSSWGMAWFWWRRDVRRAVPPAPPSTLRA
ncbi:MAG: hypothetical protein JWN46_1137 [Acidimicrobiales bacterium]|nr:hypothetical protein [Acidimicrobiales bacterium]